MSGLTALFVPASIAVLGVSRNPAKLGYRLLQNVKEGGFGGAIHPVNPSGESILGLPTVPSIDALPDAVDLALVSLPAPAVPEAIKALAARRSATCWPRRAPPVCAWSGPTAWVCTRPRSA